MDAPPLSRAELIASLALATDMAIDTTTKGGFDAAGGDGGRIGGLAGRGPDGTAGLLASPAGDLARWITPALYEVYSVDETTADVKEGTKTPGGEFWAREHYDWSNPDVVAWTVMESNFCTPGSFVFAAIAERPSGGSRVHIVWNRTPRRSGAGWRRS